MSSWRREANLSCNRPAGTEGPGGSRPTSRRRCGPGRELQSDTVHTVSQPRGRRTVVEDVPKMATTAAAMHFSACDEQSAILGSADRALQWSIEARPPGAAFELRRRGE